MLGTQANMHYFPSYFSTRAVNLNGSCSVWPSINADRVLMNGNYFNVNLEPPFPDQYLAYKDKFKQIMLQHEAIFKSQVHDLHRLYKKQRELMVEMRSSEFGGKHLQLENSTSNQILSEVTSEHKPKASVLSAISWMNPAHCQSLIRLNESKQSNSTCVHGNAILARSSIVPSEVDRKGIELLESNCKRVGKKILDLELPADEYIDSDTDKTLARDVSPSGLPSYHMKSFAENVQKNMETCNGVDDALFPMRTKCFADLNEPFELEDEADSKYNGFLHPVCGPLNLKNHIDSSSRKHICELDRIPVIVQALPCYKSTLLLRGTSNQRSCQYAGDNSCSELDLESASEDGDIEKRIKGSLDLTLIRGIDLNAISPCYSPDVAVNTFHLADEDDEFKVLTCDAKSSKKHGFDCNSMPDSLGEQLNSMDLDSVSTPDMKSSGSKFHVDLNSYINEDESSPLSFQSIEGIPENKEQPPPTGDSNENQQEIPYQLSMTENGKPEEDIVIMAAEAIVSISSSEVQKEDSLYWFAKLASSVVDDPESEFGMILSCKNLDNHDEIDYFEAMTLQLEEMTSEEYCWKATSIQVKEARPASLQRRGRTRRGRQQQDFQREILPSLSSLSRYEVNEDLQSIDGLTEGAQCRRGSVSRTGRNVWSRGRRGRTSLSSKAETPLCLQMNQKSGHDECSLEERNIIDWGKITRRRRGQRCSSNSLHLIMGQV